MAKLLETAIQNRMWELAAHALVLAVAWVQVKEVKNVHKTKPQNRRQKPS